MDDPKTVFCLLQPSLLSKDQILTVLEQRCIPRESLITKQKKELLEIFECVAKPLPCRRPQRGVQRNQTPKLNLSSKEEEEVINHSAPLSAFEILTPSAAVVKLKSGCEKVSTVRTVGSMPTTDLEGDDKSHSSIHTKVVPQNGQQQQLTLKRLSGTASDHPTKLRKVEKEVSSVAVHGPNDVTKQVITWP